MILITHHDHRFAWHEISRRRHKASNRTSDVNVHMRSRAKPRKKMNTAAGGEVEKMT
jgi:hypothetical protein